MKTAADTIRSMISAKGHLFFAANVVIVLCTVAVVFAVFIDFVNYHRPDEARRKKLSPVETGTMFLFFFFYAILMSLKIGKVSLESEFLRSALIVAGMALIVAGCVVNISGRISLKSNWANQVSIYHSQTLVTTGVYRMARHPLYASIIWMLVGGSLVYMNYIAFLSVLLVFLPMMVFRARQEEEFLLSEFDGYADYKKRVWMFSPKLI